MKIWKVLNSEIHVISSCMWLGWDLCARCDDDDGRQGLRIYERVIAVSVVYRMVYVCLYDMRACVFFYMRFKSGYILGLFGMHACELYDSCLYSINACDRRHSAAYTTGVKNMQLNFSSLNFPLALSVLIFFSYLLLFPVSFALVRCISLAFCLLSKQCMFKMHAIRTKCCSEWYEFIWFNFRYRNINVKCTHTAKILQSNVLELVFRIQIGHRYKHVSF